MNALLISITILYAIAGVITIFGYMPTIKDLLNRKDSANAESYLIWTICAAVSLLYVVVFISDLLLTILTALNFVSCLIILILDLNLKIIKKHQKKKDIFN